MACLDLQLVFSTITLPASGSWAQAISVPAVTKPATDQYLHARESDLAGELTTVFKAMQLVDSTDTAWTIILLAGYEFDGLKEPFSTHRIINAYEGALVDEALERH